MQILNANGTGAGGATTLDPANAYVAGKRVGIGLEYRTQEMPRTVFLRFGFDAVTAYKVKLRLLNTEDSGSSGVPLLTTGNNDAAPGVAAIEHAYAAGTLEDVLEFTTSRFPAGAVLWIEVKVDTGGAPTVSDTVAAFMQPA